MGQRPLIDRLENAIKVMERYIPDKYCALSKRSIAEAAALLEEQEEQKRKWLQCIADNQLANSPNGNENELDLMYKSGVWNGLQIAYEILLQEGAIG